MKDRRVALPVQEVGIEMDGPAIGAENVEKLRIWPAPKYLLESRENSAQGLADRSCSDVEPKCLHVEFSLDGGPAGPKGKGGQGEEGFSQFSSGLVYHCDGVAGCLVELFCEAIGDDLVPEETLAYMVEAQYIKVKFFLTRLEGGSPAKHILNLMTAGKWQCFADYGLCPSAAHPPSGPVLRELFSLLRDEKKIDDVGEYGDMLRHMMTFILTGSCTGAIYEALMLHMWLVGEEFNAAEVKKKGNNGDWDQGKEFLLGNSKGNSICFIHQVPSK